jgi:hypothetical protein
MGGRRSCFALLAVAVLGGAMPAARAVPPPGATRCAVFPSNNVWRADISRQPVDSHSRAWIASMGGTSRRIHPDFGPSGQSMPYGIPYTTVAGSASKVTMRFDYADESDRGPYPLNSRTPVEMGSDRHAIMIDRDNCVLYELYGARYSNRTAGSGAIWSLKSNKLRPSTWTSADAAGLPIFPGLVRVDEIRRGVVDHAIRMTASRTDKRFVWPARHQAGYARDSHYPPMGARFRLKASYRITGTRSDTQIVLRAMKKYGLIVADNGSDWYFQGTAENGWANAMLDQLKRIPAGAFEAVNASGLMVSSGSGAVRSS